MEDLASIEKHRRKTWGEQQADAYIDLLEQVISNIFSNPEIGPECPDIAENYRYLPEERHLIFYRVDDEKIVVLVIPHSSMDIENFLEREYPPYFNKFGSWVWVPTLDKVNSRQRREGTLG